MGKYKPKKATVLPATHSTRPMTPDIGQGGYVALEDGVILARCHAEALLKELIVREMTKEKKSQFVSR